MAPSQWENYSPDPTPDAEHPAEVRPPRTRKPSVTGATSGEMSPRARLVQRLVLGGVALVVLGVVALVVALLVEVAGGGDTPTGGDSGAQGAGGFADLLAALEEETGGTTVFEATIYPDYAIVDVPYRPGDEREVSYRWDGDELEEWTRSTSDYQPFDLARVDPDTFPAMCVAATDLVEDAETCYLIVRNPDDGDPTDTDLPDEARRWVWAYTSNDFGQGGYVVHDLDGTEVHRTSW